MDYPEDVRDSIIVDHVDIVMDEIAPHHYKVLKSLTILLLLLHISCMHFRPART